MTMSKEADLAALLVSTGWLDGRGAQRVRQEAAASATIPIQVLRRLDLLPDASILEVLREHLGLDVVDPALDDAVDLDALRWLGRDVAEAHLVLPLSVIRGLEHRVIRVAMADPLHGPSVYAVENASGMTADPALAEAGALERAISTAYGRVTTRLIPRPERIRPREPARRWQETTMAAPQTEPSHRLEDEASPLQQVEALRLALLRKGLVSEAELVEALKQVLRGEGTS